MDRLPLRTGVVWGWVTFGVLMLPALSDVAPPQPAMSTSELTLCAATSTDRAAMDQRGGLSNFGTGPFILAGHLFAPPPLPTVDPRPIELEIDSGAVGDRGPIVQLAPVLNAAGTEPSSEQGPVRRLPKTGPLTDDAIDRLPSVEPGILPSTDAVRLIEREVPDDDGENSLYLLPPLLEDDTSHDASQANGPPATFDIRRLPAVVPDEKSLLGSQIPPPDPLVHHLPPVPFEAEREPDLAFQDAAGELENVPAITAPTADSVPPDPWVAVIPPPLPDESQPLDPPAEPTDPPIRLPAVEDAVLGSSDVSLGWAPVPLPVRPLDGQPAKSPLPLDDATRASLERSVATIIQRADDLAARGALFAARAEMIKALRVITQTLDANEGVLAYSEALGRAMRAFCEANDFAPRGSRLASELNLEQTVSGHRTPVLKNENVDHLAPIAAQQRYLEYAQQQLAFAGGHVSAASQALYVLARIYTALDNTQLETPMLCLPQAVALHQAALAVDPRNGRAANELGVLLVRFGQWGDARQVLLHSVSVLPTPETWHNLSVVHQRLGQMELARRASDQSAAVAVGRSEPSQDAPVQSVHWVDPKTFSTVRSAPEP